MLCPKRLVRREGQSTWFPLVQSGGRALGCGMPPAPSLSDLLLLAIDRTSGVPALRQVYLDIRRAVLAGVLPPGARLPPSRAGADRAPAPGTLPRAAQRYAAAARRDRPAGQPDVPRHTAGAGADARFLRP
jgi:hypothetical protein